MKLDYGQVWAEAEKELTETQARLAAAETRITQLETALASVVNTGSSYPLFEDQFAKGEAARRAFAHALDAARAVLGSGS